MIKLETYLVKTIKEALNKAFPEILVNNTPGISLEIPKEKKFGDFSVNIAMKLSKEIRKPPMDIAACIVKHIEKSDLINDVKVEKPGFINLYVSNKAVADSLKNIISEADGFGRSSSGKGKKAQIEFVSANPTGPLTVAHGRQAAIGDSLARILKFCGYDVIKEYYINDEGVQIQALGKSVKARLMEALGEKSEFPENGYKGLYIQDAANRIKEAMPHEKIKTLSDEFYMEQSSSDIMSTIKKDLKDFGVDFDVWYSQKALAKSGNVEKTLKILKDKGFLCEQEGATWFKSTQFKDDKDRVVIKSDGSYTYVTPDMAYHREKFEKGYDKIIDILGPDHHGYINRIKAACEALGYDAGKLHIMIAQLVTLYRGGKPVRMSTREGEFVTLREIMDEVGRDAARFFFIMRRTDSHLDFDLALAKAQTLDNPVYYIQYAHARISSIIEFSKNAKPNLDNLALLDKEQELDLIKVLMHYPKIIEAAAVNLEPFILLSYLQDLAGFFHAYYNAHRVVTDDKPLTEARITLIHTVKKVLASGLGLLGVTALEKM
ncbi:MAG: arginine--tRNA ligase [Candidatus Omnitrophica bacterium CG_4_9_14_0_2_um_filter_42_8]|nr:MAG: arginine--tRNA ligase [Candidatus Omnitrophica bacterium CG22_combo_CG10-13_8_21_14_all_43_16]PJC47250.1 MAG: arginine--tRNA ligase [Candidatus Omnitrophica bacterium CG_4_9_14_0_2_um_filter_42_8]